MIVSFYDKNFKGLQNNSSLTVANDSYKLIKRPIAMDSLTCKCEAFTEDIQPTFMVIQDNKGKYIYGCLAGIPLLNESNQTEINGTDLKSMLSSDIVFEPANNTYSGVKSYIRDIYNKWERQVNKGTIQAELIFNSTINITDLIPFTDLNKSTENGLYNAYDEISKYLKFYNLYLNTKIDLINKKVVFEIGKMRISNLNIKLWEYGIKNYGKWVADINESQGYLKNEGSFIGSLTTWILTSKNQITTDSSKRDIYPIKKRVVISEKSMTDANEQALIKLLDSLYNEDITLNADDILQSRASFETNFAIYVKRGQDKYKDLPCGELHYDYSGLTKVQIGWRYSIIELI